MIDGQLLSPVQMLRVLFSHANRQGGPLLKHRVNLFLAPLVQVGSPAKNSAEATALVEVKMLLLGPSKKGWASGEGPSMELSPVPVTQT